MKPSSLLLVLTLGLGPGICWAGGPGSPLAPGFEYEGARLSLRSSAVKEVTFLKVDVYKVGLYLEHDTTPPDSIFASEQVKAFVLRFLIDVKREKLASAWMRDLLLYCAAGCDSLVTHGQTLANKLPNIGKGEEITYVVFPDRVDILVGKELIGQLESPDASNAILSAFLGDKAPRGLRAELLGQPKTLK